MEELRERLRNLCKRLDQRQADAELLAEQLSYLRLDFDEIVSGVNAVVNKLAELEASEDFSACSG